MKKNLWGDFLDSLILQRNAGGSDPQAERELINAGYLAVVVSGKGRRRLMQLLSSRREKQPSIKEEQCTK